MNASPVAELDARYSADGVDAVAWDTAREVLTAAQVYWLSTVRPQGRPHVTPLIGLWHDDVLYFCTGPQERKARNLAENPQCVVTTGRNDLDSGLDVVVEGEAVEVSDEDLLRRLAAGYEAKYGRDWHFDVRDGAFHGDGGRALVFAVAPQTAFGFGKGAYSQTRWRFSPATS
jgi:uncharacterized pyridoxamine 5'-phosphate oxidase family protein